jgi:hypothetical protein
MTVGEAFAAATGTALAFIAALGAALKLWPKRPEDNHMHVRVAKLEERADEQDRREGERMQWRVEIFGRLLDLDKKTSAILAILDERREHR